MARRAILRRRLIEQDRFGAHGFRELVALGALHVLVGPPQREGRPLFMVKQGWLPLHAGVAVGAGCGVAFGKLAPVDIFVAFLAKHRRSLEIHIHEVGFEVRRLMTVDAGRGTVSSKKRVLRLGVVESG